MFEIITFVVAVTSMVLHFVSKRTKTTKDDKAAEIVDKVQEYLPLAKPLFPADAENPAAPKEVTGFKAEGGVRDHRS